jgi:hypothetical protein
VTVFRIRIDWRVGDRSGRYEVTEPLSKHHISGEPIGAEALYYQYTEGNYGCDCTRAKLFGLGSGWSCGDTINADVEVSEVEAPPEDETR